VHFRDTPKLAVATAIRNQKSYSCTASTSREKKMMAMYGG
jgi:hypothetical protein